MLNYKSLLLVIAIGAWGACNSSDSCKKDDKSCCSKGDHSAQSADTTHHSAAATTVSAESVFDLTNTWTTQDNRKVSLGDFGGKITIMAMVFTHCESACPRIVADMQRIESALSPDEQKKVSFLLVTMDPLRDTPAQLSSFAVNHQLSHNWTLLTATEDESLMLANVLNVRIKKLSSGGFDHSNTVYILNQTGNITHRQEGLSADINPTVAAIKQLIANNPS